MSNETVTTQLTGGVIRNEFVPTVSPTDQALRDADPLHSGVSDGATLSVDTAGNVTTKGGTTRYNVNNEPNPNATNVMDTLRSPGGRSNVAPQDITSQHTVVVDGTKMSVGAALALGWVRRTANGLEYTGTAQGDRANIEAATAAHYANPTQPERSKQEPTPAKGTGLRIQTPTLG